MRSTQPLSRRHLRTRSEGVRRALETLGALEPTSALETLEPTSALETLKTLETLGTLRIPQIFSKTPLALRTSAAKNRRCLSAPPLAEWLGTSD